MVLLLKLLNLKNKMEDLSKFNISNYKSKNEALKACKIWYKNEISRNKLSYKNLCNQDNLTAEQKGHFFDECQKNISKIENQYKAYVSDIKTLYSKVKLFRNNSSNIEKFKHNKFKLTQNENLLKKILTIFLNKKVLSGIFFTLFLLIIFHIASIITIPGISIPKVYNPGNDFAGMLNLLAGGGLTRMSIFAVGVGPYITSQIIVQLLSSDLVPPLTRMAKQGEIGKRKLEIVTRILNLPFCVIQSYAVIALILNMNNSSSESSAGQFTIFGHSHLYELSFGEIVALMSILTGGSYVAIFFGDMITKRGVGNGITVIILAGILSNIFGNFQMVYNYIGKQFSSDTTGVMLTITFLFGIYILFYFLVLLVVTFINDSIRKIPIQQTGEGLATSANSLPYLPIKFNSGGVIPVIFASSISTIPNIISQFLQEGEAKWFINDYLTLESWFGMSFYFILIILFSFFYSYIQLNPPLLEENFAKSGKFIPGVKSSNTAKYITKILNRVNWLGGPFLAIIATLPYLVSKLTTIPSGVALGGTGVIIIVSSTIEIWNSIKSAATNTGYEITKTKIQSSFYASTSDSSNQQVEELW